VTAPDGAGRRTATGTLFLARVVYAFNWYNIGAVLSLIRTSFGVGGIQVGIVLGAFLLGAGVFQLPAGFAAMRWGARRVSILALLVMGAFSAASAASPNWEVLAALRFGAGAGAAFFFSPALALVASYYPSGTRGPVIGVFNAGFSLGSGAGLFLGALVGAAFGWPWALLAGGLALLVVAGIAPVLLPPTVGAGEAPVSARNLWRSGLPVLRSRPLWALSLAIAGLWAAFYAAAQYFVEFASEAHPGWSLTLAASVPTVMIAAEVVGGPVGGWFAERRSTLRRILLLWGIASGVGIALVPWLSLTASWPLFAFLGFADGVVFAVLYLLPSYLPELAGSSFALGLALLNSIQIFLGSGLAIAFAVMATWAGYSVAWAVTGAVAIAFLPFLLAVPDVQTALPTVTSPSAPAGPRS
jgi:predicted MFS family arabinose efflux permease